MSPNPAASDAHVPKRCATCSRVRAYEPGDAYCLLCGSDSLERECICGRAYDYALGEGDRELHCPRCGLGLAGRLAGLE